MDTKLKKNKYNIDLFIIIVAIAITLIVFLLGFWPFDYYLNDDYSNIDFLSRIIYLKPMLIRIAGIIIIIFILLGIIFKSKIKISKNIVFNFYTKLFTEIKLFLIIFMFENLNYIYSMVRYWYEFDFSFHHWYRGPLKMGISVIVIYCIAADIINTIINNKEEITGETLLKNLFVKYIYVKRFAIKDFFQNILKGNKNMQLIILIVLILIDLSCDLRVKYLDQFYTAEYEISIYKNIEIVIRLMIIFFIALLEFEILKIKKIAYNISQGKDTEKKQHTDLVLLKDIEDDLNNIDTGLKAAVEEAVKSERMKSELITNVSHDLKTPLTSIINYVDILDNNTTTEEDKKKYIGFLKNRSARLKILIEDLLEASKAASGNVKLNIEKIELNALIRQTLGEYDDRIKESNLDFIINIPEEKIFIDGDGRRLFRVFANLITNILKYSLDNSRVYIDMYDDDKYAYIVFKNISKYILNVEEDELLEKFKRGDSSRSTEGNGLGLVITKSLVELHHGKFEIKVDGDLFKAIVRLNKK